MIKRTGIAAAAAGVTAVSTLGWVLLGTPGLGSSPTSDVLQQSPEPSTLLTPTPDAPTPMPDVTTPPPSPTPSATPSPTPSPRASRSASPEPSPTHSPTPSPTPAAPDADVGSGAYASVLLKQGYGFCPCDVWNMRQPAPATGLSLTCADPGQLPSGKLVTLSLTVRNTTSAPLSFTELAGPRFVYLSLANDPGRTKDMNGGWADNAGHTSSSNGWWADPGSSNGANLKPAGTVGHVVPANGKITLAVLGATVRASDAKPLLPGPYYLEAGFVLDTHGNSWTCPAITTSIG